MIEYRGEKFDGYNKRINMMLNSGANAKDILSPFPSRSNKERELPKELGKEKDGTIYNKNTGEVLHEPKKGFRFGRD